MDAIDRFFHQLVQTLRASHPQLLSAPFEVSELYSTILPYRHHRRALEVESNQEYELTLLELLSGSRGYLQVDDRVREVLARELAAPTPDASRFREFATSQVTLAPGAVERIDAIASGRPDPATAAPPRRPSAAAPPMSATPLTPPVAPAGGPEPRPSPPASPRLNTPAQPRGIVASPGERCRYCSGELPAGRRVVFCPHCGQDLSIRNCPACGSELELGWRYCVSCGRSVAAEGAG